MRDATSDPILQMCAVGQFGDLRLGVRWPNVVAAIGQPTDFSVKRRYGDGLAMDGIALYSPDRGQANLQVFVEAEHVAGIWLYVYGEPDLVPLCMLVGETTTALSGAAGVASWTAAFDAAGIRWRFDADLTFDDQARLLTQANACCVWGRDEATGTETLNKIGLSAFDSDGRR